MTAPANIAASSNGQTGWAKSKSSASPAMPMYADSASVTAATMVQQARLPPAKRAGKVAPGVAMTRTSMRLLAVRATIAKVRAASAPCSACAQA